MAKLLFIETATQICSVAITDNTQLLALNESNTTNSHSAQLTTFIQEALIEAQLDLADIDAFVISEGPGSFTGLRIGVSSAKGYCYSLDKPLIAVNTLQSMANGMCYLAGKLDEKVLFCPMIDARRMEVYTAIYDSKNNEIEPTSAKIIDENSFTELLKSHIIYFGGDGADKCKTVLSTHPNARFLDNFQISSKDMIEMASTKFNSQQFENVAYFEPYYLKDFIAGLPKVKGLK